MEKSSAQLPKSVVCFAGSRDYYQLALALQEAGLLEKLVTDLYWEPRRIPFGVRISDRFPTLLTRHAKGLSPDQVITPPGVMVDRMLMATALASRTRQIRLDRAIGLRARREAWKSRSALFSYSYYAARAFAPGEDRPRFRFLFQLHPHPVTVRKILKEEMIHSPKFAGSLQWEHELGDPQEHFNSLCEEPRLANGWVVASSYTAATLAENGVPRDRIHVVPYGVDFEKYPCRDCPPPSSRPFRVIWVGSMAQRKGLSYFLEAIRALPQDNLEVLICGRSAIDQQAIHEYGLKCVHVLKDLPTAALTAELRASDLFVLPSLAEGFGHAILEAMASGLPVLTTAATCAPDVFTDGEQGFIVPIRDSGALAEAITWGRQHRSQLFQIGQAAATRARTFTWDRFRTGIVKAYGKMVERIVTRTGNS
jgi:glycosyltransferase involved in cell wall biosynthesis